MHGTIGRLMVAVASAAAVVVLAATGASASTGPKLTSGEAAGYSVNGAQFRFASASVYTRNAGQYASLNPGLGYAVHLSSATQLLVLGISASTAPASSWSPAIAVFNPVTHALIAASSNGSVDAYWCASGGTQCQPATAGGAFPAGERVTEQVYYDRAAGMVDFEAYDGAGNVFRGSYHDPGQSFTSAFIGTEFGVTPFDTVPLTVPSTPLKVGAFSNAAITTYKGARSSIASWFSHSKVVMAGVAPSNLNKTGTSFTVTAS